MRISRNRRLDFGFLRISAAILLCLSIPAEATQIEKVPLKELVAKADFVVVGTVQMVDMIDSQGHGISDPEARTGPGYGNTIRWHVALDRNQVLKGNKKALPNKLIVPMWPMWHSRLGDPERRKGYQAIFLLKGPEFTPSFAPEPSRRLTDKAEIESLLRGETPSVPREVGPYCNGQLLQLQGIIPSTTLQAIINGEMIQKGDQIGSARIADVSSDGVILNCPSHTINLRLEK